MSCCKNGKENGENNVTKRSSRIHSKMAAKFGSSEISKKPEKTCVF